MMILWRPDLKLYKATVLEEVPASSPFDPPAINASLTPKGGLAHPEPDSFSVTAGQIVAATHSDKDGNGAYCKAFGSFLMNPSTLGWAYAFKQGAGDAVTPYKTDNATGIINEMQVTNHLFTLIRALLSCAYARVTSYKFYASEAFSSVRKLEKDEDRSERA
jgi:hypothetical protein